MNDPIESTWEFSPEEKRQFEPMDLCQTLYVLWNELKLRGRLGERQFYSCRNNSNVPDSVFCNQAGSILSPSEVLVDHGDVMILTSLEDTRFRQLVEAQLQQALGNI